MGIAFLSILSLQKRVEEGDWVGHGGLETEARFEARQFLINKTRGRSCSFGRAGPTALILAIFGFVSLTAEGRAQTTEEPDRIRDRIFAGVTFGGALAVGEFSDFVHLAGGAAVDLVFHLDDRRVWSLRTDVTFLEYGRQSRVEQVSLPVIGNLDFTVTTTNQILAAQIGPQFTLPGSSVRPYFFGTGGFSNFRTSSGTEAPEHDALTADGPGPTETHFSKYTWSSTVGGGALFRIHEGNHPVLIDVSAAYLANGRVRYLTKSGIQEPADGTLEISPIKSQTNLILLRLGVSVGIN